MTDISNLSDTVKPKSNQLNSDDLLSGPITVTIEAVARGTAEQPVRVSISGGFQPYYPCKSMRRVLIACWGDDGRAWVGRSMTLYADPAVKFGGVQVGGIRISHLSDIQKDTTLALTVTKAKREPFTVKKLAVTAPSSESPFWPQAKFAAKLAEFAPRLKSGERTPQQAVEWFEQKAKLTTAQIAEIEAAAVPNVEEF